MTTADIGSLYAAGTLDRDGTATLVLKAEHGTVRVDVAERHTSPLADTVAELGAIYEDGDNPPLVGDGGEKQ